MTSKKHTDQVYQPKGRPKTEIKFNFPLNEEQKLAKEVILNNVITVLTGLAGSGKTLLSVQIGLDLLFTKGIDKIIIARPIVTATNEEMGFLPGDIKEKMDPFMQPIYENMESIYGVDRMKKVFEDKKIEIVPFSFMRGRNLKDCFVILDEAQNATDNQIKLLLTRLCKGRVKTVVLGDITQSDLTKDVKSGLPFLVRNIYKIRWSSHVHLLTNHRHDIVEDILELYKELE